MLNAINVAFQNKYCVVFELANCEFRYVRTTNVHLITLAYCVQTGGTSTGPTMSQ